MRSMSRSLSAPEISRILHDMAVLMEVRGDNPFKARAYANASRLVESWGVQLFALVEAGTLAQQKGIGPGLTQAITELVATGRLAAYDELRGALPAGIADLIKIPGLGPKKIQTLFATLAIQTLGELEYACIENRLTALRGFGAKTQEKILAGIAYVKQQHGQHRYDVALAEAESVLAALRAHPSVKRASIAGSLRRRKDIVKDADLVASTDAPEDVMAFFTTLPRVERVTSHGPTRSAATLVSGIAVDLRVVDDRAFPYALHHSTGSKEHHTLLRGYAKQQGLKMNEYGLFRGEEEIRCDDEAAIYAALGLAAIPPELREGTGEIEAAAENRLPDLVDTPAILGVFHAHTTYSDGRASVEEMARAAHELGYRYLGISDHSQAAHYANGMSPERVVQQRAEIAAVREKLPALAVFHGAEVDILPDGSLDYPDELLASLDFVIASVHSQFGQSRDDMTRRVVRAIRHPAVTMLGHATGRLILAREAYALDMDRVLDAAAAAGVVMELNANPRRLDIDWRVCREAKSRGILLSINPDAHRIEGLRDVGYGVGIARKGWLEASDVFNTRSAAAMTDYLARRRERRQVTAS